MAVQTFIAGGTITRGRCVKQNASGQIIQATVAGERCVGIALQSAVSGDIIAVACEGEFVSIGDIDGALTCATDLALQTAADGQLAALAPVADSGDFSIAIPVFNTVDTAAVANDVLGVIVSVAQVSDPALAADLNTAEADIVTLEGRDLRITLSAAAEAANAIAVTMTQLDSAGAADLGARQYYASLRSNTGVESLTAAATITVGAGGAADSANTNAQVYFSSLGAGTTLLTVTDVTGVLAGTLWLEVQMLSQDGTKCQPARIACVFA